MRSTLSIERLAPSYRSITIGVEATILSGIDGISDLPVDAQRIDGAWISCESAGPLAFAETDQALGTKGMKRV